MSTNNELLKFEFTGADIIYSIDKQINILEKEYKKQQEEYCIRKNIYENYNNLPWYMKIFKEEPNIYDCSLYFAYRIKELNKIKCLLEEENYIICH